MTTCPVRIPEYACDRDLQSLLSLELVICDAFNHNEQKLVKKAYDGLRTVIMGLARDLTDYRLLERFEPALSSLDEKKQLRCSFGLYSNDIDARPGRLRFDQRESVPGSYFTFVELLAIGESLRRRLDAYMGYEVRCNIVLQSVSTKNTFVFPDFFEDRQ